MASRCKEPCLLSQKPIKNKNNPGDSQERLDVRLVNELRQQPKVWILCWITTTATAERMLRGKGDNAGDNKRKRLPCRSLWSLFCWRDVQRCLKQDRWQTESVELKNKDEGQSSSECTAYMLVAVPHLKGSPRLWWSMFWFPSWLIKGPPITAKITHCSAHLK